MRLLRIFHTHPVLSTAFAVALALTGMLAVRTTLFVLYWADPAHRDLSLRGWMTPGYVAHTWHVPRSVVGEAIGALPEERHPTLKMIAAHQGIEVEELASRIEADIEAHRQAVNDR